jgi:hypothetical protein
VARSANRAAVDLAPFAVHPFAASRARPARGEASREPKDAALFRCFPLPEGCANSVDTQKPDPLFRGPGD